MTALVLNFFGQTRGSTTMSMKPPSHSRFPASVYGAGEDPDPRFSLANERTFLAWNRTALALIAGGVALETLGIDLQPGLRLTASLILLVAGALLPVVAWFEWGRVERALRLGSPLPGAKTGLVLVFVIAIVAVLMVFGVLLR